MRRTNMSNNLILRNADQKEIKNWDTYILQNKYEAGFLQSSAYAETKRQFGWHIRYVVYESTQEKIYAYFLEKKVPLLGYLWYMPSGSLSMKYMDLIVQANRNFTQEHDLPVFTIKIEPKIIDSTVTQKTLLGLGLLKTRPVQAQSSTIILDLQKSNLLESLAPKARRDIRLAAKQSIEAQRLSFSETTSKAMYELMKTVGRGKGSTYIRPYQYYRTFWQQFTARGNGDFYFAYENGRPVVGAFVINFGKTSTYKDGGSSPTTLYNKRYSMAVQWQAIQDAEGHGYFRYDLCGVPHTSELYDPTHPYYGIGQFKLKFKKETLDYCGCYDQVLRTHTYTIWVKVQRLVYKLYWLKYHDLYF